MVIDSLLEYVAYLHDARCLEVTWDSSRREERVIHMKVVVHPEAGLPCWNGKTLLINLSRVFAVRFTGWGTIADECIDSWGAGVSDFLKREYDDLLSRGLTNPPLSFIISFSSGSELEVICSEASALVID